MKAPLDICRLKAAGVGGAGPPLLHMLKLLMQKHKSSVSGQTGGVMTWLRSCQSTSVHISSKSQLFLAALDLIKQLISYHCKRLDGSGPDRNPLKANSLGQLGGDFLTNAIC